MMRATFSSTVLSLILLAGCGTPVPEHEVTATPRTAEIRGEYGVYVTNEQSGDLTVIDPAGPATVATIPLGKRPRGIRSSPDGRHLYIALSGSPAAPPGVDPATLPPRDRGADGIGVVTLPDLTLQSILRGPSDPEQVSVSADGHRLYIANEDIGQASVVDIATGATLSTADVGGEPEGVTTSPDGRWVYVTSESDGIVSVIQTSSNTVVARIPVGARPRDSAFAGDGVLAYVTAENEGTVSVVDTARHRVLRKIQLSGELVRPMGVVVSPDNSRVYVTTGRGGTVVAIDTRTWRPVATIAVGSRPWGIGISPDGSRLYTANGPSNDVSVIDTTQLIEIARVPVGRSPWGVAVVRRPATTTAGL
jgi:YVTN family beta-propeller protein